MWSPSIAKATAENATRVIGVAIRNNSPSWMMARGSPENAALVVP